MASNLIHFCKTHWWWKIVTKVKTLTPNLTQKEECLFRTYHLPWKLLWTLQPVVYWDICHGKIFHTYFLILFCLNSFMIRSRRTVRTNTSVHKNKVYISGYCVIKRRMIGATFWSIFIFNHLTFILNCYAMRYTVERGLSPPTRPTELAFRRLTGN